MVSQILALKVEKVKDIIVKIPIASCLVILHQLKMRFSLLIQNDNFSIQNRISFKMQKIFYKIWKKSIKGILIARNELDFIFFNIGKGSVSIPFYFKEPFWIIKSFFYQRRQHG